MKFAKAGLLLLLMAGTAQAELTGNLGFASDYYFRGVYQAPTSGSGGLDYESGGFYIGTWAADVKDGLETDLYFGYGTEVGDVSLSIGYTGYFYTGDFDDTYQEINLGAGLGIVSLDVAIGEYDGDFDDEAPGLQQDYIYYALTLENNGFYGTFAGFAQDASGKYLELGYGTTVADIDLGIALIVNDKDANIFSDTSGDESLIFTIGKSFDIN